MKCSVIILCLSYCHRAYAIDHACTHIHTGGGVRLNKQICGCMLGQLKRLLGSLISISVHVDMGYKSVLLSSLCHNKDEDQN